MEIREKRQAALLAARIGFVCLAAFFILVLAAYGLLSQNFQNLLTDYTIKLVQSMVEQGVTTVEYELRMSQEETAALAKTFPIPALGEQAVFPAALSQPDALRLVYVSEEGSTASDGRRRDVHGRPDITAALSGEEAVYGPYFNEEGEYVICYSAPVLRDGKIVGALSAEKDRYYFCSLIETIRSVDSGESYIINAEGTDIAVSNRAHIAWVSEGYNAGRLLEAEEDPAARSILELEQRGLAGETGVGTYQWEGSLYYVVYAPIPSTQWVLLAGLRQEELAAMTQATLYATVAKGPALILCVTVFLLLTALIMLWIVSSMKTSAETNEKLKRIASYDALTGIKNRNSYHTALARLSDGAPRSLACVYIDANGLHEINNRLGHQAGDKMLKTVAEAFLRAFPDCGVYRIGGDEFVVLCRNLERREVRRKAELARKELEKQSYGLSIGIEWRDRDLDVKALVNRAEEAMQRDKRRYYQDNGRERQMRTLDRKVEQMLVEKQDADAFLSILAPEFKGVYFVDLGTDTIRHLYIPHYFEQMLQETGDIFSKALFLYVQRIVMPKYRPQMEKFCDYNFVESWLCESDTPEFIYQKTDGVWLKLQILKFKTYTSQSRETLWIFSNADAGGGA